MISRAIVRPPAANFADGLTTVDLGVRDYALALEQHESYCAALESCGLRLTQLAADLEYPDATFVEDTAVLTSRCAIVTRPGADSRRDEVKAMRAQLAQCFAVIEEIVAPGTLDGGDVCQAGDHFFIGVSRRTNQSGAEQLVNIFARHTFTATCIDIRDSNEMLHLKSGLAYLGQGRLVAIESLADRAALRDYDVIRVPAGSEYATNCVALNGRLLIAAGYPDFERAISGQGLDPIALAMTEFQKMDGGLSCLSLRW